MRWSLISSALASLQPFLLLTICLASPFPAERKDIQLKLASHAYRENAKRHPYVYEPNQAGELTRQKVPAEKRLATGNALIKLPKMHADHLYELQMVKEVLEQNRIILKTLNPDIIKKARKIINGPQNMALVPARRNIGKGAFVRHARKGKTLKPKADRDQYIRLTYTRARSTARKLDLLFAPFFKPDMGTFSTKLSTIMRTAKILQEGQPSPPETSESDEKKSGQSSPARPSSRPSSGSPTGSKGANSRSSSKSSGKGNANIRPHSPVASTSKLPGASNKAVSRKRGRSQRIEGKGKKKAVDRQRSSSKSSGSAGDAASKRAMKKSRSEKGRQK